MRELVLVRRSEMCAESAVVAGDDDAAAPRGLGGVDEVFSGEAGGGAGGA